MRQILLRPEIPLRSLEFPTRSAAEFRRRAMQVMWRDIRQASVRDVRLQHLPDDLVAHPVSANLIAPIYWPEQMGLGQARDRSPGIDRILHTRRHRDRPDAPVLADQIDDALPVITLLNVFHRQIRQFRSAQSAPEQRDEHGPSRSPLLRADVRPR
jgi:hypothetical protein